MKNAAIYIRTGPGVPESMAAQDALARKVAADLGLRVVAVLRDGPSARRPAADAAVVGAGVRFEAVIVARVALLGRNLPDLLTRLAALTGRSVRLLECEEPRVIEPSRVDVRILLEASAAYRREAVALGRARARARGVRFGRPSLSPEKVERARTALAAGTGVRATARAAGISPASVIRIRSSSPD